MIVCSCTVISDRDIEGALLEILRAPDAPIPTPGIVYRHLVEAHELLQLRAARRRDDLQQG